jgi:RNA polymerase sigma-70 factor (ECF subfamily)
MQQAPGVFPTTQWGLFADIRNGTPAARRAALDILIRRYWQPVFLFLRRTGQDEESAKDLTQGFFADWIENDVFSKADQCKGRFRSFMLTCLKRFAFNQHRADHAQKRRPVAGLVSLDELMGKDVPSLLPADGMTPDMVFDRAWASAVVMRVLRSLEHECRATDKTVHYDIFARRIINPILNGSPEPSMADLGREHGLTEKQAANHLLTAKRGYQRLLQDEIRLYAASESEVADEVRSIFRILGKQA